MLEHLAADNKIERSAGKSVRKFRKRTTDVRLERGIDIIGRHVISSSLEECGGESVADAYFEDAFRLQLMDVVNLMNEGTKLAEFEVVVGKVDRSLERLLPLMALLGVVAIRSCMCRDRCAVPSH